MVVEDPRNERRCGECGQVTLSRRWQPVNFCVNCGVEFEATGGDREHVAVGLSLSADQLDQLFDGEEVALTRAIDDDHRLTVHLVKRPP